MKGTNKERVISGSTLEKIFSSTNIMFGFVSERLLDLWIETNKFNYVEMPYVFMEKQNWFIKGSNFIKRKLKAKS